MKLLSLFDGSGGFPLAASQCGITPIMASEVEPYPIAVTSSRFPQMRHLGDISKINGAEIEPVDVITFGSPCQDLSVAGKRAGMKHADNGDTETTRSGLFMEAVRIIKEMRRATHGKYPKFAVWENVPGAFSSNKGEDFRMVLEELIKIVEPSAEVPAPDKGKWPYADVLLGDRWSVAYRVFDAQYWGRTVLDRDSGHVLQMGTPQRRRRIYLVADFTGESAGEILFKSARLPGNPPSLGEEGQEAAADAQGSPGTADQEKSFPRSAAESEVAATLYAAYGTKWNGNAGAYNGENFVLEDRTHIIDNIGGQSEYGKESPVNGTLRAGAQGAIAYSVENHPNDSRVNIDESGKCQTLTSRMGTGGGNVPMVMEAFCKSGRPQSAEHATTWKHGAVANTLNTFDTGEARANELVVEKLPSARLASGRDVTGCLMASGYDKLGAQEMFSGDYTVIEERSEPVPIHDQATRHTGKRGTNTDGKGNGLGIGHPGDPMNTLTSGDRHAVAYSMETFHCVSCEEKTTTLKARDYKDPNVVCYGLDRASFNQGANAQFGFSVLPEQQPTLTAKGPGAVCSRYIVRRLTPTECARLQGFPDTWGHPPQKDSLTDEEYAFWQKVRNTHATINGRAAKEYTKAQMLSWYNRLHTDSSEYKMWGNGIALPNALYVMQGIADQLQKTREDE